MEQHITIALAKLSGGVCPAGTGQGRARDNNGSLPHPKLDLLAKASLYNERLWQPNAARVADTNQTSLHADAPAVNGIT